ncbi:MAG: pilus assembly protein PilM [Planctomycetia bacterium]|nr:pilus assembly protein PilM [Planctomycetia bacterium]
MVLAAGKPGIFRRRRTRSTGWIGIDIGAGAVKLAQVEFRSNRWVLARTALVPWPEPGPLTVESVANGQLAGLVREALRECGDFRGRDAACLFSPTATELVTLEVPAAAEPELYDLICQELSAHREGSSEDLAFDYWEAHPSMTTSESGAVAMHVVGVRRELVEQSATELDAGRLTCRGVDGAPFTLARALLLTDAPPADAEPVGVLDWGHSSALLAVVSGGQPVFSRALRTCGCAGLMKAVETALSLSSPEARHLLATCGVSESVDSRTDRQDLPEFVAELLRGPIDEMLGELHKTLAFLKHQSPALAPWRIWLTGGGATVRNMDRSLAAGLGLAVRNWRAPQSGNFDGLSGQLPVELFANAAALSLGGLDP